MKIFIGCGKSGGGSCGLRRISVVIVLVVLLSHRSVADEGEDVEAGAVEEGQEPEKGEDVQHEVPEAALSAEVSTGTEEHEQGHGEHEHPAENVVKGHGESCGDDVCDSGRGLSCVEGKCECDTSGGQVYLEEAGKCEHAPPHDIPEVPDNSLEGEEVMGRNGESESEKEGGGGGAGKEEEEPATTTSTTTPAAVEVMMKDNSLEEGKEGAEEHNSDERHFQLHEDTVDGNEEEQKEEHEENKEEDHEEHKENEEKIDPVIMPAADLCANVNCQESLGHYSKCEEETGECHCNDVDGMNHNVVNKDGHCFINRDINDPCESHDDCTATITGKAWCHLDDATQKRFCQCELFHYFDVSLKECLPLASDGLFSPCKTDQQCTGTEVAITGHGLGPQARCNMEKGHCECKLGPDGQKEFLYENYCFYQMMPGDHCNFDRECEVSFPGQNVGCVDAQCKCKSGEDITTVSCPLDPADASNILGSGFRLHEDGIWGREEEEQDDKGVIDNLQSAMGLNLPNFVFILIIGAVVLLVIVILSVFVVKKRHKYSVVRSREPADDTDSPL